MEVAGVYRSVRQKDHAVPHALPRPLLGGEHPLDIRAWPRAGSGVQGFAALADPPGLVVSASRRTGNAVRRNRFKRRVRMAMLEVLAGRQGLQGWVLFIRPGRRAPKPLDLSYATILASLRQALAGLPLSD